jgi:nicotinate-nucleotide pyrophosphorylase (carboxylating)
MNDQFLDRLIQLSLDEDLGSAGDVTTKSLIGESNGKAELWAKEEMVLSGLQAFVRTFELVDSRVEVKLEMADGNHTKKKQKVATLTGPLAALLIGERTALNIVQRTSGIATLAAQAAAMIPKDSKLKVLDTRKTPPGMRALAKAAVVHGGAYNHRFGLFDGVLIKDNHIAAVGGSIAQALKLARKNAPRLVKIEIEVCNLEQLKEAISHGANIVMLDNMNDQDVRRAVDIAAGRVELEVSGGVTLARLPILAEIGVDYVSMGALTHSARAMDLSLEMMNAKKVSKR